MVVAHVRKSLADVGFTVGGFYLGETFTNTGGIRHGATYDGVLWTYLNGDLHKTRRCGEPRRPSTSDSSRGRSAALG